MEDAGPHRGAANVTILPRTGPEAFDGDRLRRPGRVAVGFLASWCPFCRAFEPEFARLAEGGRATVLVADMTSDETPLWDRFHIETVPTVVVFDDGRAIFRADGVPGVGLGPADLAAIGRAVQGTTGPGRASRSARRRSG